MNAGKPVHFNRAERLVRSLLAFALLAGVAWALADGSAAPVVELARLLA